MSSQRSKGMSREKTSIPVTAYVRESYAREKHPDNPALIELRRQGFDHWLAAEKAATGGQAHGAKEMSNAKMSNGNTASTGWTKPRTYRGHPWTEVIFVFLIITVTCAAQAIWG